MTAPGKSHREGISLLELAERFPDEASARAWFEKIHWPDGRHCGHCGSTDTKEVPNERPMPYWCRDCQSYFSVRTGTTIQNSRLPLRKWVFAIYLYVTSLKGVSSMKLHRDLKVTQKTAWFMLHRLRETWDDSGIDGILGPIEVDETFVGGKRKNMPKAKRKTLTGRGTAGKTAVVGAKDRFDNRVTARVVENTDGATLEGFVRENVDPGTTVFTDEASAYRRIASDYDHEAVNHSAGEYVRGTAHTNGIESFWATLKRAHKGTFHHFSVKHLDRYVTEFVGRHNVRDEDTADQMADVAASMVGKRLTYRDLIA